MAGAGFGGGVGGVGVEGALVDGVGGVFGVGEAFGLVEWGEGEMIRIWL